MDRRRVRRMRAGVAVAAAIVPALVLSGCATTIDNGKLENAIRNSVSSNYKVRTVSCPSGVTAKAGGTITCNLTVTSVADGSEHSGTVTVHMVDSSGHVTANSSDYHLH